MSTVLTSSMDEVNNNDVGLENDTLQGDCASGQKKNTRLQNVKETIPLKIILFLFLGGLYITL